jgi:hypothetical protein
MARGGARLEAQARLRMPENGENSRAEERIATLARDAASMSQHLYRPVDSPEIGKECRTKT